ncbi:recombinase family protein [Anaerobacillus sp. HL2]|nr:recombinase family protein [Anaerobacillus sp. HL2]
MKGGWNEIRCAIYIRVSTKLREDRFSLGAQSSELNAYAKRQGWNIIGQYKDVKIRWYVKQKRT